MDLLCWENLIRKPCFPPRIERFWGTDMIYHSKSWFLVKDLINRDVSLHSKKCGLTGAHIVSSAVNKSKFRDLGRFRDWPIKMGESLRSQETPTGHPVHHPWDRSRKAVPVPRSGRWFPLAQANSTFATFDVWPWGRFALHGRETTWETT